MRHLIAISLLVLSCNGCAMYAAKEKSYDPDSGKVEGEGNRLRLGVEWKPLELIRERPGFLGSKDKITTVGSTAYVADLDYWLERHLPNSPMWEATLTHEREHSKRQLKTGVMVWVSKYMTNTDFMWAEEARGWYLQIKILRRRGLTVNVAGIANTLASYKNLRGRMVKAAVALKWVQDVLAGRWTPPTDD